MSIPAHVALIGGPLIFPPEPSRTEIVQQMAADLVAGDAFRNEADAMRCLMGKRDRYRAFHVVWFVGDAMQVAAQGPVAKEMSGS